MNWTEIKNKTPYEILKILEMKEPPFNPFDIARKLNLSVKTTLDYDKLDTEGQISINQNNEPEIWINPIKSEARQRFTLAHELGHLANDVLPQIDNPIIDKYETLYRGNAYGGIETKANRFAAKLLMPLKALENFIERERQNNPHLSAKEAIMLIATKFEVSKQAAFHRLQNIGLISKDYRYPF
ncbi:ImmA/IrrE family metallo-endopeptidase [Campylobacter sp. MIT 21-1685]|uniref:ImmA/IrrE family metallo-endopeptidase n=1 Tax=unclassified Campylobacter TaxID=2593542 RepID=UPI00224B5387|nr:MULTISPECIES: ImmA/IrrE family metallo-endopeptidase [unclassified Campylobacter]MCX2683533.1 ImmA/IrrE family metallo-endopeptidase [Campylobacter sp. MIT 21-1684]MCX2751806.1 ImmA/IrrE family metallo-endopeptidase [Campylobacter sp. MIT 21-1682]MCX2808017.1 ImmA/IrrE family metallo-endopeptidase [Campylobacter sp. MIT 21-1685]